MTAAQILAAKSDDDLRAAIEKGRGILLMIKAFHDEGPTWDGPFPPSKAYENWCHSDSEERARLAAYGILLCEQELARRRS